MRDAGPNDDAVTPDLEKLLPILVRAGAEFVVIGGVAGTIHGSARATYDIDLLYSRTQENIARLADVLAPYRPYLRGAPANLPFTWDAKTIRSGLNFTFTTALGDIDLLGEVAGGETYQTLLPHSFEVEAFGIRFKCIDLPTLIRIKEAAGRRKDQEAIAELRVLLEEIEKKQS
jgi:predicted nucleotidyltransferase